jgi:superfamily II DNA or RNA helicase
MTVASEYETFIDNKRHFGSEHGFEPLWMPSFLFDFQAHIVDWAIRRGRAGIFADCGLGKTPMQLVWAENVRRKTGKPVLIMTPLAVSHQTVREAQKFDIEAARSDAGEISSGIVVSNYERLHHFDPDQFSGIVADESGILKSYNGKTRKLITRFMRKLPYRLLCTATPSPNDYVELGTSSEALGELTHTEMLKRFFKYLDDKGQRKEQRQQDEAERIIADDPNYYRKLAYRVSQSIGQWRLKHHAVVPFWRWVASWSMAMRMPSDLGFYDGAFKLPELIERDHIIKPATPPPGLLFNVPAVGMHHERQERRRTLAERCDFVRHLVDHDDPAVIWCHMNDEGDALAEVIPDAEQVSGKTPDDTKIDIYERFASGNLRVLVIKPKIGAWGLNWQHCAHVVTFATHSYEQYYQSVRRCWRFGQTRPVRLDVVATEGEIRVLGNMRRKAEKADAMFDSIIREVNKSETIKATNIYTQSEEVPEWLSQSKSQPINTPCTAAIA